MISADVILQRLEAGVLITLRYLIENFEVGYVEANEFLNTFNPINVIKLYLSVIETKDNTTIQLTTDTKSGIKKKVYAICKDKPTQLNFIDSFNNTNKCALIKPKDYNPVNTNIKSKTSPIKPKVKSPVDTTIKPQVSPLKHKVEAVEIPINFESKHIKTTTVQKKKKQKTLGSFFKKNT